MLNANYDYDRNTARNLVYPTGTEGWKTVGTLYNGLAGYLSWKDAKERAARLDKAQNDYFDLLKSYLGRDTQVTADTDTPVEETEPTYNFTPTLPTRASYDEERQALANRMAKQASEYEALDNYHKALAAAQKRNAGGLIGGM